MGDILYIVVPCYNEQEVLAVTAEQLRAKLAALKAAGTVGLGSKVLFVDDGSRDNTWGKIADLCSVTPQMFAGLKLTRNRGHQNALLAGLHYAKNLADVTISMDADLQDDVDAIDQMIVHYHAGCQVVYGVRSDRSTDTAFKRGSAQAFYKLMKFLGVDLVYNHADYRLLGKRALEDLTEFEEVNLFLRGMVPLIGYPSATVEYHRGERYAGESKYPLSKMLNFAWDGVTSFSTRPIRWITLLGALVLLIGAGIAVFSCIRSFWNANLPGWPSLMVSHWLLAGLQILSLGIVGEYVGKIYLETKKRPRYFIEEILNQPGGTDE